MSSDSEGDCMQELEPDRNECEYKFNFYICYLPKKVFVYLTSIGILPTILFVLVIDKINKKNNNFPLVQRFIAQFYKNCTLICLCFCCSIW